MIVVFEVWASRSRGTEQERKRISSVIGPCRAFVSMVIG